MTRAGILIFFHCNSNTNYAIGRLEKVFLQMALKLTSNKNIYFGYLNLSSGMPSFLPINCENVISFNSSSSCNKSLACIHNFILNHKIEVAFGFDQPISRPSYSYMRKAGIKLFVSYWGAPMSSINSGIKLAIKKLEVLLRKNKPDHFIFESQAMADTALLGRGVPSDLVSVIHTGVDAELFKPKQLIPCSYVHEAFNIPHDRKIICYAGHMEKRKGVDVILKSACLLINNRKRRDVHFLLLGDISEQEYKNFQCQISTTTTAYVTFAGYRKDINRILPCCYLGVIASTGWDSFPMTSLEMAASGLPIVASALHGIIESVAEGETGLLVMPGSPTQLADGIEVLLDAPNLRDLMGEAARKRISNKFSIDIQISTLELLMNRLIARHHLC